MHTLSFESRGEEGGGILRLVCCIAIDLGANRIGMVHGSPSYPNEHEFLSRRFFFCFFIGFSFDPYVQTNRASEVTVRFRFYAKRRTVNVAPFKDIPLSTQCR